MNIHQTHLVRLFIILVMGAVAADTLAQERGFDAQAVFGLNLAQIDGDQLYGYTKLGLTGGVNLSYPIYSKGDLHLEMLYSQRGSTSGFGFGSSDQIYTDLQYIEIPLYVDIKDWLHEDGYFKVRAHAGLSYSYLFAVDSSNGGISNDISQFNRSNVSALVGVDYQFNKRIGLTLRWTRGLHSIYVVEAISYFITARTSYSF